jgi:hypothetical protein
MGLGGLVLFMAGMWAMILAVAAFLVIIVAPLEAVLPAGRPAVSVVQAAIAIAAVAVLVLGLSRMKRIYMHRKLGQ